MGIFHHLLKEGLGCSRGWYWCVVFSRAHSTTEMEREVRGEEDSERITHPCPYSLKMAPCEGKVVCDSET